MGLSSRQPFHARNRHGSDCRDDRRAPVGSRTGFWAGWFGNCLIALAFAALFVHPVRADALRIATYNADLSAKGPGLVLQDLLRGGVAQREAAIKVIVALDADILLLTGIDYDLRGQTLAALGDRLAQAGCPYPYVLALRPNSGVATGLDIDRNGKRGEPRDAMGYGRYAGEGGMAVLSRLPIDHERVQDFSGFLWADLPGNLMPMDDPARAVQPLSSTGHWAVPVGLANGQTLWLLAYYATPPVFDGPEDRNGRRNHDETAFWLQLLNAKLPFDAPSGPFVLLGQPNLDPADGEGRPDALQALMAHPSLQRVDIVGSHGRKEPGQSGDPAFDTALYAGPGGLRVEQILPSLGLKVTKAGVFWPAASDPFYATLAAASRHFPLWIEIEPPP